MVIKIFVGLVIVSTAVMALVTGYSVGWLQSIGDPSAAIAGYQYHAIWSWPFLWISWIVLLGLGNVVMWSTRRAWGLWVAFVYFSVWIAIRSFWLEPTHAAFSSANGISAIPTALGPILALVLIFIAGAVTFFDQFIADRMYQKMYPSSPSQDDKPELSQEKNSTLDN